MLEPANNREHPELDRCPEEARIHAGKRFEEYHGQRLPVDASKAEKQIKGHRPAERKPFAGNCHERKCAHVIVLEIRSG